MTMKKMICCRQFIRGFNCNKENYIHHIYFFLKFYTDKKKKIIPPIKVNDEFIKQYYLGKNW
jgi:hypothetical protein